MNLAIIGLGNIVQKSILPALSAIKDFNLVLLGSEHSTKANVLAKKYGCQAGSYDDVINADNIDAVYIALPNHLHFCWGKQVLQSGKHLLCEKPLVMTLAEALELKQIAMEQGLILMEAFMYRFHPQHSEVRKLIFDGSIGQVRFFEACFSYSLSDKNNIRLKPDCGGGALMDVGCYGIDSARFILNQEPIGGVCFSRFGEETKVDEISCIQLEFANGIFAQIRCATDLPREQGYTVYGTEGSIEVLQPFLPNTNKPVVIKLNTKKQHIIKIKGDNIYMAEFKYFYALIKNQTVDKHLYSNGYENVAILEKLRNSKNMVHF